MAALIKQQLGKISILRNLYFRLKQKRSSKKNVIKGAGNIVNNRGRFYKVSRRVFGDNNSIHISEFATVRNSSFYVLGNNNKIEIGRGTTVNNSSFWIEGDDSIVRIGERVEIIGANFAAIEDHQRIEVGDDCLFSIGIELRTSDSHSIIDLVTSERVNQAQDIIIGEHVWIGASVSILKGTNIGSNSVIGTKSVVAKNIPPNTVVAGIPAKVIKTNITWSKDRI